MSKTTLLMIHGLVGSLDYFRPASRIAGARVYTCDLLGYGAHRDASLEGLTVSAQADHVAGVISRIGGGPVWLLAHSMGGAVAIVVADRFPELVAGMINVEGNFTLKDAFWSAKIAGMKSATWEQRYQGMVEDVAKWVEQCGIPATPQRVEWMRGILINQPAGTVYVMSKASLRETGPAAVLPEVLGGAKDLQERAADALAGRRAISAGLGRAGLRSRERPFLLRTTRRGAPSNARGPGSVLRNRRFHPQKGLKSTWAKKGSGYFIDRVNVQCGKIGQEEASCPLLCSCAILHFCPRALACSGRTSRIPTRD